MHPLNVAADNGQCVAILPLHHRSNKLLEMNSTGRGAMRECHLEWMACAAANGPASVYTIHTVAGTCNGNIVGTSQPNELKQNKYI